MFSFFVILLITLLVQIQLVPVLGIKLDLLVLLTIYWGLLRGWQIGLGVGLLAGYLGDIFSAGRLGLFPFCLVLCGLVAGYSRGLFILRFWVVRVALVFLLTLLNVIVYMFLVSFFYNMELIEVYDSGWFSLCINNTVLAALLFWLQDRYG